MSILCVDGDDEVVAAVTLGEAEEAGGGGTYAEHGSVLVSKPVLLGCIVDVCVNVNENEKIKEN